MSQFWQSWDCGHLDFGHTHATFAWLQGWLFKKLSLPGFHCFASRLCCVQTILLVPNNCSFFQGDKWHSWECALWDDIMLVPNHCLVQYVKKIHCPRKELSSTIVRSVKNEILFISAYSFVLINKNFGITLYTVMYY